MDSKPQAKPITITGLWKSQDGQSLVGTVGGVRYVVAKNRFKEKENHPDYQLVIFQADFEKKDAKKAEEEETPF